LHGAADAGDHAFQQDLVMRGMWREVVLRIEEITVLEDCGNPERKYVCSSCSHADNNHSFTVYDKLSDDDDHMKTCEQ